MHARVETADPFVCWASWFLLLFCFNFVCSGWILKTRPTRSLLLLMALELLFQYWKADHVILCFLSCLWIMRPSRVSSLGSKMGTKHKSNPAIPFSEIGVCKKKQTWYFNHACQKFLRKHITESIQKNLNLSWTGSYQGRNCDVDCRDINLKRGLNRVKKTCHALGTWTHWMISKHIHSQNPKSTPEND